MVDSPIGALIEPNLQASEDRTLILAPVTEQLFDRDLPMAYDYLFENRIEIAAALRTEVARAEFALRGWRASSASDWAMWSEALQLGNPRQGRIRELAVDVLVGVLEECADLKTSQETIEAGTSLRKLAPALAELDSENRDRVEEAARATLGNTWAESEEEMSLQAARHQFLRDVEETVPSAKVEITKQRSVDAAWPIENDSTEMDLVVLRGWRQICLDLEEEAFDQIVEAIPTFDRETQPEVFAEAMACRCVVMRNGGYSGGSGFIKTCLNEMSALRKMEGDYQPQIRIAAAACVDLAPSSTQLRRLLAFGGPDPSDRTRDSVKSWSTSNGEGPTSTVIKEVMPFPMAKDWMRTFSECKYDERPILKRLQEVMLESDNTIDERVQFAAALQALGLRDETAPNRVAAVIAKLLSPRRKHHHANDRRVALILCSCLRPDSHQKHAQIENALIRYANKWDHKYKPKENRAILETGVALPEKYLSQKAKHGFSEAVDEVASGAKQLAADAGRFISKFSPFST